MSNEHTTEFQTTADAKAYAGLMPLEQVQEVIINALRPFKGQIITPDSINAMVDALWEALAPFDKGERKP